MPPRRLAALLAVAAAAAGAAVDGHDACTFVQEAGDFVLVPANWAHAILNEAPVVGAAFEHLDAYLIASNSRRVFA